MSEQEQAAAEGRLPADEQKHYRYAHPVGYGFGQHHFAADPSQPGDQLHPEMRELDLKPDAVVVHFAHDADTNWPIIQWTDDHGTSRLTTVDPEFFADHFVEV
jgi:hypothetical protein